MEGSSTKVRGRTPREPLCPCVGLWSMIGSHHSSPSCLVSARAVSTAQVMGSSLIMHKEPKKRGGFSGSKRGGGAGPPVSAGGAAEQETKEVRADLFFLSAAYTPKVPIAHPIRYRVENPFGATRPSPRRLVIKPA